MASDDTILHLAVADFLVENLNLNNLKIGKNEYLNLVKYYKKSMENMENRGPGKSTIESVSKLCADKEDGYQLPFNERFYKL